STKSLRSSPLRGPPLPSFPTLGLLHSDNPARQSSPGGKSAAIAFSGSFFGGRRNEFGFGSQG
ncbi:MAG: hypothetical protein WB822_19770, partial [Rhodoplanes sp.]